MVYASTPKHTRVLVIGAGPGGYAAAFRAADLGLSVTIIDTQKSLGGTCLHAGCIPSKAILHAAKLLADSRDAREIGIDFGQPQIDIAKIREWKNSVVSRLASGLGMLCKQKKVSFIEGQASFLNSSSLRVVKSDGSEETIGFDHAIIATGSLPVILPFAPASGRILNSTTALDLREIPQKLLVIGGGYIGLELGTAYAGLGSEVSVVEMTPSLLPGADRDLVSILERRLKKTFKAVMLSTKVTELRETANGVVTTFEDQKNQRSQAEYSKVLIAVGRRPNTAGLGLENTKIKITPQGFIEVNDCRQTADPKIYAVGDITGNPMLAHKATAEGHVAAESIAGQKANFAPKAIPSVVFTDPEIAWVGLTETEAKSQNRKVTTVKMPWLASGRAVTLNRADGFTKILADPKTEMILGMAIVGVGAGELISEGALAIEMAVKISDLKKTIHPHPTLSESIMDTAKLFFR